MKLYRLSQSEFRSWRDRGARAALERRVFDQHGTAQLRAPSGRILGTVRSPQNSGRIPIERSVARGTHHAVSPRECLCREWQKPQGKQDQHHPICVHKQQWEAQQHRSPDVPRARAVVGAAAHSVVSEPTEPMLTAATTTASPPELPAEPASLPPAPAPSLQSPDACICREWAGAVEGKHHPLCTVRKAWESHEGQQAPQLVELETGSVIREATDEEALASKRKATEDGVGAIELSDGKLYYVKEA